MILFLNALNEDESELQDKDSIELNRLLKKKITETQNFNEWPSIKIMRFFYESFKQEEKYYKVSPGKDAECWEECLNGGFISVGWNEMGDLGQYTD